MSRPTLVMALLAIGVPMALAWVNADWLSNQVGDLDTWFYYGYFKLLEVRSGPLIELATTERNYFETRLPFLVPGWLVHAWLGDAIAVRILHVVILNGVTALCLWAILREHLEERAAALATVWMVCDLYYLRSIGWDYVDGGVLAYSALTLLLISKSTKSTRARLFGAGFAAMSMVVTHLMSVIWLPIFAAYQLFVVHPDAKLVRRLLDHVLPALSGGVACLLVYCVIGHLAFGAPFLFFAKQLDFASGPIPSFGSPMAWLAQNGHWLIVHGAVCVAAIVTLAVRQGRLPLPTDRFGRFWIAAAAITYPALLAAELMGKAPYLSRGGMYVSQVLVLAYLAAAVLAFGTSREARAPGALAYLAFPAVAVLRLATGGTGFQQPTSALTAGALLCAAILIAAMLRGTRLFASGLALTAACYLLVPVPLSNDSSVRVARAHVDAARGGALPRVLWRPQDPNAATFRSVAASFTDHADARRGDEFPKLPALREGELVAVMWTGPSAEEVVADRLSCAVTVEHLRSVDVTGTGRAEQTPIGHTMGTSFSMYLFKVTSASPASICEKS